MEANDTTILLTRAELRALLAHAAPAASDRAHLAAVAFDLVGGRAWATDGHRAVLATSCSDSGRRAPAGTPPTLVARQTLDEALRLATGRRTIAVRTWARGQTAADGHVLGPASDYVSVEVAEAETGKTVATLHTPALDAQSPDVPAVIPRAEAFAARVAWTRMDPKFLRDLATVADAAEATGVQLWAAETADALILVEATGPSSSWRAAVMPQAVKGGAMPPRLVPATGTAEAPAAPTANVNALPAESAAPPATRKRRGKAAA